MLLKQLLCTWHSLRVFVLFWVFSSSKLKTIMYNPIERFNLVVICYIFSLLFMHKMRQVNEWDMKNKCALCSVPQIYSNWKDVPINISCSTPMLCVPSSSPQQWQWLRPLQWFPGRQAFLTGHPNASRCLCPLRSGVTLLLWDPHGPASPPLNPRCVSLDRGLLSPASVSQHISGTLLFRGPLQPAPHSVPNCSLNSHRHPFLGPAQAQHLLLAVHAS